MPRFLREVGSCKSPWKARSCLAGRILFHFMEPKDHRRDAAAASSTPTHLSGLTVEQDEFTAHRLLKLIFGAILAKRLKNTHVSFAMSVRAHVLTYKIDGLIYM